MNALPPQVAQQRSLQELDLIGTSLRGGCLETLKLGSPMLSASLSNQTTLKELTLSDYRRLQRLPNSVEELKQLTKMEIISSEIQYASNKEKTEYDREGHDGD